MKTKRNAWVNYAYLPTGTEVKVKKSYFDHVSGRHQFLFEVCDGPNKGFTFYSSLSLVKPEKKRTAGEYFYHCLSDYISAGWDHFRIIKAGLCPVEYRYLLPQYIKYFSKLQTI
jgi:hypothetical protein